MKKLSYLLFLLTIAGETLFSSADNIMSDENKEYWSDHYARTTPPSEASTFAVFVLNSYLLPENITTLTEFGCGGGRDSKFFASHGLRVVATDNANSVITRNSESNIFGNLQFCVTDVSDLTALNTLEASEAYYARFFLHSLPQSTRNQFLSWLGTIHKDALLCLEFRTDKDPMKEKSTALGDTTIAKTDHFRRFESKDSVKDELIEKGFGVLFEIESAGLSIHGDDDPVLARLILKKLR
ncbi:MAG: hypothetical protein ACK4V2_06665 [Pseudomonadota bacterium]|jgi:hypothetical protein|nr:hypothetical protein [Alphaproteobacteria bacterium]